MTTWGDLAAVALLGAGRRPLVAEALPAPLEEARAAVPASAGDALAVLDLAALATAYRRAGVRPARARALPPPAPGDARPVVARAAASRLVTVLARGDAELLELWLATAADRAVRPPDRLLPALLDAAARQPAVAAQLFRATGPRARWLAPYRAHWAAVARSQESGEDNPPPDDAWSSGSPAQRLAWLHRLRAEDSGAARDLLEAGWAREAPAERAVLLGVLEAGLGPDDEPFLERCLDDRRGEVRTVAAGLLTRLPGSAFAGRAAARALAAVRVERQLLRRRLVVAPAAQRDEAAIRDQVGTARHGAGPGGGWVRHVVAAAPLDTWVPALAATPAELVSLDVDDGRGALLWCSWAEATLREEDARWADALLSRAPEATGAAGAAAQEVVELAGRLVALLPVARRAELVARRLAEGLPLTQEALAAVPAPWPDRLAHVVVERLAAGAPAADLWQLLALAARRLPAGWAPALAAAGARRGDPAVRRRYEESADLILFRSALLEEIR